MRVSCFRAAAPIGWIRGPGGSSGDGVGNGLGGPKLTVTFDVEGETTLKGSVTENVAPSMSGEIVSTCADYARGSERNGKRYFVLPLQLNGDLGGQKVALQVLVREYTGPGNYTEEKLAAEGVSYGIRVNEKPYVAQGDGSGSIVSVDAGGAGSFSFERLAFSTGADTSPGISGQVSWACAD